MNKYQYKVQGVDYDVEIVEVEGNIAKVKVNGIEFEVELKEPIHASTMPKHPIAVKKPVASVAPAAAASPAPAPVAAKPTVLVPPLAVARPMWPSHWHTMGLKRSLSPDCRKTTSHRPA